MNQRVTGRDCSGWRMEEDQKALRERCGAFGEWDVSRT